MDTEFKNLFSHLNYLNTLDIEKKLIAIRSYFNTDLNNIDTLKKLSSFPITNPNDKFINFILSLSDFYIIKISHNLLNIQLLKKDFSLFIEISLSSKMNITSNYQCNNYYVELLYLVPYKNDPKILVTTLEKFINFHNETNIPIVLYCTKYNTYFYENYGFKVHDKTYNGFYIMLYK